MKAPLFFLFLNLVSLPTEAHPPAFKLIALGGAGRAFTSYNDAYATRHRVWQPYAGLGGGLSYPLGKHVSFSSEAVVEYYGLVHDHTNAKSPRHVTSDLRLGYLRLSPGLSLQSIQGFLGKIAFSVMWSIATMGQYSQWYVDHTLNQVVTETYVSHFANIKNPLCFGPEFGLGIDRPVKHGGPLGIGMGCFVAWNPVFQADFITPYNPKLFRLNLGAAYTFPSHTPPKK